MNLTINIDIDIERIRGLLCCAFGGGSNYWCRNLDAPESSLALNSPTWSWCIMAATTEGHHVTLEDGEEEEDNVKVHKLDLDACKRGLAVMAAKYPQHFGDILVENEDAITGDVFLQCALFGEVIYG